MVALSGDRLAPVAQIKATETGAVDCGSYSDFRNWPAVASRCLSLRSSSVGTQDRCTFNLITADRTTRFAILHSHFKPPI